MSTYFKRLVWLLLLVATAGNNAFAADRSVVAEILQIKQDRLYFSVGQEELVLAGAGYCLICGADTLIRDTIEVSIEGVSYSRPIEWDDDSTTFEDCLAVIETAPIDTTSDIILGVAGLEPSDEFEPVPCFVRPVDTVQTDYGNRVIIRHFKRPEKMRIAWEHGEIDGYFSFEQSSGLFGRSLSAIKSPAPFCVGLAPNLSKPVNSRTFLTTSLYYRYDGRRPGLTFEGDEITACNRLYPSGEPSRRTYDYDPDKGRRLLERIQNLPRRLGIALSNRLLSSVRDYYADILARDRLDVFSANRSNAHLYLILLPYLSSSPNAGAEYLYRMLAADTIADATTTRRLAIARTYLGLAGGAGDDSSRMRYLQTAATGFSEDIGVFPLFRPTIWFTPGEQLRRAAFDSDGFLKRESLILLAAPDSQGENR